MIAFPVTLKERNAALKLVLQVRLNWQIIYFESYILSSGKEVGFVIETTETISGTITIFTCILDENEENVGETQEKKTGLDRVGV